MTKLTVNGVAAEGVVGVTIGGEHVRFEEGQDGVLVVEALETMPDYSVRFAEMRMREAKHTAWENIGPANLSGPTSVTVGGTKATEFTVVHADKHGIVPPGNRHERRAARARARQHRRQR